MMPIAILCGGLGTRLGELTRHRPKSLVEVAGKPFIDHQLELLKRSGFTDVVLCIGHKGHAVQGHIALGDAFGLNVKYSQDGYPLLGTAGALRKALPKLGSQFFILYGDVYPFVEFEEMQRKFDGILCMSVYPTDLGNIDLTDGGAVYNKWAKYGMFSDAGLLLMDRLLLDQCDFTDLAHVLSFHGALGTYVTNKPLEIGSHEGLAQADAYLTRLNHATR